VRTRPDERRPDAAGVAAAVAGDVGELRLRQRRAAVVAVVMLARLCQRRRRRRRMIRSHRGAEVQSLLGRVLRLSHTQNTHTTSSCSLFGSDSLLPSTGFLFGDDCLCKIRWKIIITIIALETLGTINKSPVQFLTDLGHRITLRLYRSAVIQRHVVAPVVWERRRPGPSAIQLFKFP